MKSKFFFNSSDMKERRQELRNKTTPEENLLWEKLRKNQIGHKFIRQYSIRNYVVDFYCPGRRLVIEIDGKPHSKKDQKIYDDYRTRYINAFGIKVIRFKNDELKELDKVIEKILEAVSPS